MVLSAIRTVVKEGTVPTRMVPSLFRNCYYSLLKVFASQIFVGSFIAAVSSVNRNFCCHGELNFKTELVTRFFSTCFLLLRTSQSSLKNLRGFVLTRFFIVITADPVVDIGKEDAEEGAQEVEEGVWYIFHGGYAQYP